MSTDKPKRARAPKPDAIKVAEIGRPEKAPNVNPPKRSKRAISAEQRERRAKRKAALAKVGAWLEALLVKAGKLALDAAEDALIAEFRGELGKLDRHLAELEDK
jgi:hypothetical protein